VTIVHEPRPFRDAVRFMNEHIGRVCAAGDCEWVLLLETDEFLFLTGGASALDTGGARTVLRAVPDEVTLLRYGAFLGSSVDPADAAYRRGGYRYARPAREMTRFHDQGWDKLIVRASAFGGMTQWCHHARVTRGREARALALGLLHFHDAGLRRSVQRAIPVVHSYGYVDVERGSLDERLAAAQALHDAPIACGHKVEQYRAHLRREATLVAFRRLLGRMPASVAEMERYSSWPPTTPHARPTPVPRDAIRRDIDAGLLQPLTIDPPAAGPQPSQPSQPSWDALLYHEERKDHVKEVNSVALDLSNLSNLARPVGRR
jgi:hypothetical protein